ncbi:hypothetical protein H0A61_02930 [Koleobacter methoxysyntrophicus]|jgi:hypothetical protein|uniref:Uncharacterized protein n=1 Tax=Koleobacter methoxysyntrophicus TaxID=2751313 RepID=A0A8A0RRJ5_9FIRM|nr:hypothetical protein [Koleobacter methoxysyntrophicus]QSQ10522.1 hypothetical protein H0A61_02930 [Koleobacter methoxysyntrophicus]
MKKIEKFVRGFMKMQKATPVEVKVRCGGELHRIVLSENGQLCLCNHHGKEEETENRCGEILKAWQTACRKYPSTKEKYRLPQKLRKKAKERYYLKFAQILIRSREKHGCCCVIGRIWDEITAALYGK